MKSVRIKSVRDFVVPPVLCVWGSLLEPHESVASSAQRQTSDPVSPLLLRTVTITKGGQDKDGGNEGRARCPDTQPRSPQRLTCACGPDLTRKCQVGAMSLVVGAFVCTACLYMISIWIIELFFFFKPSSEVRGSQDLYIYM